MDFAKRSKEKYSVYTSEASYELYVLIVQGNKTIDALKEKTGKSRVNIMEQLKPLKLNKLVEYKPGTGVRGKPAQLMARTIKLLLFFNDHSSIIKNSGLEEEWFLNKKILHYWKDSRTFKELITLFEDYIKYGKMAQKEVSFNFD